LSIYEIDRNNEAAISSSVFLPQIGSLKRAHHFGLKRAATFGEQLILQDSVTQSMSSPVLSPASAGGAAAAAAGDRVPLLAGADGWAASRGTAWLASGSGFGSSW